MIFKNPLFIACVSVDKNMDEMLVVQWSLRKRYILVMSKLQRICKFWGSLACTLLCVDLPVTFLKKNVEGFFAIFRFYFSANRQL